jgi:hypothetical protein
MLSKEGVGEAPPQLPETMGVDHATDVTAKRQKTAMRLLMAKMGGSRYNSAMIKPTHEDLFPYRTESGPLLQTRSFWTPDR